MCLFRLQVASARLQSTIERPQFIGSSIETLLFGIFFYLVMQRKGIFHIFDTLYVFFYSSIFALEVKKDLRPRLTRSRAWDIKVWQVIVSASSLVVATLQAVRAVRASPEGKIRAAVAKAMEPFEPTRKEDEVIKRRWTPSKSASKAGDIMRPSLVAASNQESRWQ